MLHTAEAALEGNFSARATLLPEELPRPRDAAPQDEFHHAGPDVLAKEPHQRARREIRHVRNRFNREALGENIVNAPDATLHVVNSEVLFRLCVN